MRKNSDYAASSDGDPLLVGAVAHFACRIVHTAEVLDPVLFCGEATQAADTGKSMRYQVEDFF